MAAVSTLLNILSAKQQIKEGILLSCLSYDLEEFLSSSNNNLSIIGLARQSIAESHDSHYLSASSVFFGLLSTITQGTFCMSLIQSM